MFIIITSNNPAGICTEVIDSMTLVVSPAATVSAGADATICEGDDHTLSGSMGGSASSVTWSSSGDGSFDNTASLTAIYSPGSADISAGTVDLTLTTDNPSGLCNAAVDIMTLTINQAATASAGVDDTICEGSNYTLSGTIGGSSTSNTWTTSGDGIFDNTNILAATYTPGSTDISSGSVFIIITSNDPAGICGAAVDTLILQINSAPTVSAGSDSSICEGSSYVLVGSMGGSSSSITWTSSGDGVFDDSSLLGASYSPGTLDISAGSVVLTITSNNPVGPCSATNDSMVLLINSLPVLTSSSLNASCGLSDGEATVTPTGNGPFTYLWDSNASSQTDSTATGLSAGNYDVSVTDAEGCVNSTSVTVSNLGAPVIDSIQLIDLSCTGLNDGDITVFASGGTSPIQFSIDSGFTYQSGSGFDSLSGGTYQIIVMDSTGCVSLNTQVIILEPTALSLVSNVTDVTCNGDLDGATTVTVTGGTGAYTYIWSPGAQTDSSISGLGAGLYTVTVTDENNCDTSMTITITQPTAVVAQITGNNVICSGNSTVLVASGGGTYLWNIGDTSSSITVMPLIDTTFSVTVTVGLCSDSNSVNVFVSTSSQVTISGTTDICIGENLTLVASAASNYLWSPGGETTQSITVSPTGLTVYSVLVADSCGSSEDSVTVVVNSLPSVFAGMDDTIALGTSVTLVGSGGPNYVWSTGDISAIITVSPQQTTTYYLLVTDANGCVNSDTVTISVEEDFVIFIPEIFSPSSLEPKNSIAYVQGKGIKEILTYIIYDRWGEKVFENSSFQANDLSTGWDGKFRGETMSSAVFVYYVEAVFLNGKTHQEKGDLTLIQ